MGNSSAICSNPVTPELADIEHVGPCHTAEPAAAHRSNWKPTLAIRSILEIAVGHRVEGLSPASALDSALGVPKVDATVKLTHHPSRSHPLDHLRLEACPAPARAGIDLQPPQIGEQLQASAPGREGRFRRCAAGQAVRSEGADPPRAAGVALAAGPHVCWPAMAPAGVDRAHDRLASYSGKTVPGAHASSSPGPPP